VGLALDADLAALFRCGAHRLLRVASEWERGAHRLLRVASEWECGAHRLVFDAKH